MYGSVYLWKCFQMYALECLGDYRTPSKGKVNKWTFLLTPDPPHVKINLTIKSVPLGN